MKRDKDKREPEGDREQQEHEARLYELKQLVSETLKLGRAVRYPLAKVVDSNPEEAAWSGLSLIEARLSDPRYQENKELVYVDLEKARDFVKTVFPHLKSVVDELDMSVRTLGHYLNALPPSRNTRR